MGAGAAGEEREAGSKTKRHVWLDDLKIMRRVPGCRHTGSL